MPVIEFFNHDARFVRAIVAQGSLTIAIKDPRIQTPVIVRLSRVSDLHVGLRLHSWGK